MACEEIGDRLMAYLDGELSGDEAERMERHLAGCGECAEDVEAYRTMRRMAQDLRFREPPPDFWDEYPRGVFQRLGRGFGWILIIGFGVVLALYGLICLWTSDEASWVIKVCVTGVLVGFGILLVSVMRQRIQEARTDPYKEIIR